MREILFRGKRKDNGDWATATSILKAECFGEFRFYINSLSGVTAYFNSDRNITRTKTKLDCEWLEVIQETVGQFTGLTDMKGTKIFEGDILKWDAIEWGSEHLELVKWDYSLFSIRKDDWNEWCEVVGNIYDNPELLKNEHPAIL
jgi:uncharacterized phage protein (TIGR01671 family)